VTIRIRARYTKPHIVNSIACLDLSFLIIRNAEITNGIIADIVRHPIMNLPTFVGRNAR
jgi:hypothetical protein